jgi:hypothetical protein
MARGAGSKTASSRIIINNIKAVREAVGVTYPMLAQVLGVSPASIFKKFSGTGSSFTIDEVTTLAVAMGLERWDLFRDEAEVAEKLPHLRRLKPVE